MENEEVLNGEEEAAQEPAEASLEEILDKKAGDGEAADEGADEEPLMATGGGGGERVEPLAVKVVPQQPTEFVCKKCFLVKHRSQLADKKRLFCRDCA